MRDCTELPLCPELSEHTGFGEHSTARALCHVGTKAVLVLIPAAAADFDSSRFRLVHSGITEALRRSWPEFPWRWLEDQCLCVASSRNFFSFFSFS